MNSEELEQLSAEYALGLLQGDELSRFEAYLQTAGPDVLREIRELSGTAALLPVALERRTPPERVKELLRQKIRISARAKQSVGQRSGTVGEPSSLRRRGWARVGVVAGTVLAVVGMGALLLKLNSELADRDARLVVSGQKVSDLSAQITVLKDELTRKEELLAVLSSQRVEITLMSGLKVNPVGFGKIIWDPEKRTAILQVSRLPMIPENKEYQLWVVKGKTPISAGLFSVSDTSANFFKVAGLAVTDPHEISAFAVTLEPKGGLPAPTGDMYLAGSPKL